MWHLQTKEVNAMNKLFNAVSSVFFRYFTRKPEAVKSEDVELVAMVAPPEDADVRIVMLGDPESEAESGEEIVYLPAGEPCPECGWANLNFRQQIKCMVCGKPFKKPEG